MGRNMKSGAKTVTSMPLGDKLAGILHVPSTFPVIDAKIPMTVNVTEAHTKMGLPKSPDACAMSLACREQNPKILRAVFYKTIAYLVEGNRAVRYNLSKPARDLIRNFDGKKGFTPGEYLLLPPTGHSVLGSDHGRTSDSKTPTRRATTPIFVRGYDIKTV